MQLAQYTVNPTAPAILSATVPAGLPPAGWSPPSISTAVSTRPAGLVSGGLAAWRGIPETAVGTLLTPAQVDLLASPLASHFSLPIDLVRGTLARTQIVLGGLAAGAGNVATTIGTSVYVSESKWATHIMSWAGRGWLAHELAHTMQWLSIGRSHTANAARDRAFLNRYLSRFAHDDGDLRRGALVRAALDAWRDRRTSGKKPGVGDRIHDSHPMEIDASRVASAFVAATALRKSE
jgi:hypothetical protein